MKDASFLYSYCASLSSSKYANPIVESVDIEIARKKTRDCGRVLLRMECFSNDDLL